MQVYCVAILIGKRARSMIVLQINIGVLLSQERTAKQETTKKEAVGKSDDNSSIYSGDSAYGTVTGSTFTLYAEQSQVRHNRDCYCLQSCLT